MDIWVDYDKSPSSGLHLVVAAAGKGLWGSHLPTLLNSLPQGMDCKRKVIEALKSQQKKSLLEILHAQQKWKQTSSEIFLAYNAEDLCLQLTSNSLPSLRP